MVRDEKGGNTIAYALLVGLLAVGAGVFLVGFSDGLSDALGHHATQLEQTANGGPQTSSSSTAGSPTGASPTASSPTAPTGGSSNGNSGNGNNGQSNNGNKGKRNPGAGNGNGKGNK